MRPLTGEFYSCSALEMSEKLLGKTLVHVVDGIPIGGIITETEAYMGVSDKASHAYGGNITASVYGNPEAVLIRSVVPYFGVEKLYELVKTRSRRRGLPESYDELSEKQKLTLTNGPGKLCTAMGLSREDNGVDMTNNEKLFVQDDGIHVGNIEKTTRVGIDYAEEAALYPWRFVAHGLVYPEKTEKIKSL